MDGQGFDCTVDDARRLLGELDGIQLETRADFHGEAWQWMALWAVVCAGAAASAFTPFAGVYWLLGAPVGMALSMLLGARAGTRTRLRRKPWPAVVTGVCIGVANGLISWRLEEAVIVVAIWVVLGLGFSVLMTIERIPLAPTWFSLLAIASAVAGVAVRDTFALYPVIGVAFCVLLGWCAFRTKRAVTA
jgi:hypothetical protein